MYKVISIVLAERMKTVMVKLISREQRTFIKGRSILDGVLIANEMVDFIMSAKKSLVFKVDFEKAYDSVEWSFLLDGLKSMGFGKKWRGWIEACLKSSTISILINGASTNEFPIERGLRQGNPLAPFLLLIIAEGLHIMVEEAMEKGLLKGVRRY